MHARLVQNHMRELGKAVLDVLNSPVADDAVAGAVVRLPEGHLVDPVGLFHHALAEAKGLEHLHAATRDAVGLAERQGAQFLFDDPGPDLWERRELRRRGQTRRAAADNEDVHLLWKRVGLRRRAGRFVDLRIARSEAVQMELHVRPLPLFARGGKSSADASSPKTFRGSRKKSAGQGRRRRSTRRAAASRLGPQACYRPGPTQN